jgi:hypothetical protein
MLFGNRKREQQTLVAPMSALETYGGPAEPAPKPKRRGLFGSGISLDQLAGAAGDALSVYGGGPAIYAQRVERQRQERQQAQLAEARRAAGLEDYRAKQQIEQEFRPAPNNDTVNDYNFLREKLGEEGALQYLRNLGDPMVNMTLPGNRVYSGPRSGLGTAMGAGSNVDAQPISEEGMDYTPGPGGRANPSNWKPSVGGQPAGTTPFGL